MSEKVRALNLTSGNVLATASTPSSSATAGAGYTLIGAPTLISSTFTSSNIQPLSTVLGGSNGGESGGQLHTTGTGGGGSSDTESSTDFTPGPIVAQLNFHLLPDGTGGVVADVHNSIMNSSQISATSNESMQLSNSPAALGGVPAYMTSSAGALKAVTSSASGCSNGKHLAAHSVAGKSCRFPKLEECAHFHYERVQLGPLSARLVDDKSELLNSSIASQSIGGDIANGQALTCTGANSAALHTSVRSFSPSNCWFIIKVIPHRCDPFLIKRSFDNMQMLDEMLHRCVYDRKISGLKDLQTLEFKCEEDVEYAVDKYLERFSRIASDSLTCGTILTWFQLDNKGRRLPLADGDTMRSINTPAVGAAYGVRRYQAQASDEISIEVGDMISVIDMPSPAESIWWRGKKSHLQKSHYEVGFFPQSCVATIGDKVPRHFPMPAPLVGQLDVSPTKPVLRKHGKLIAFFRSFILSRPSRRRLKQTGIYRERVFSCDLSEHLLNSGQEIPMVLKCCAEFIEQYGIVDGIYRLSGITSNIQKLRRAFDEERVPDLGNPEMKQDIHAVSSLLKMYFRELPNPLCTYQLYDNFVEAIQAKSDSDERLQLMKETVLKLPPPHYRTLKYLSEHLHTVAQHSGRTGMTDKNLAIVWAPNLLRSPALESGGVAALRGVGVQAVVTEYLIRNCHHIFDALEDSNARLSYIATAGATPAPPETRLDSLTDCESLLVEQREHDQSLSFVERPKSLSAGGPKLISLEEAQERHSRLDGFDMKQSMPINMIASSNAANIGSYIEVGGGPSSLPDKYHTVLSVPRSWQKRKTHSWKSLFSRNQRTGSSSGGHELKLDANGVGGESNAPPHKEASQVTFAESDAIITSSGKLCKALHKQEKPKSIELFETSRGECGKPVEICVRSNSIDSLRTAGHSRSVSHDSYFDLLQSPQRSHMTTCPSRELSELGLNFDREEPEMRIFSESESLVSSPRVGKENIPPSSGAACRRILRARPEEFSSQTNSVNPSPKKQPRLNLLLSPSSATVPGHNWAHANTSDASNDNCKEHVHHSSDESCCKRYKLEDQLSDIQFIDCGTPEHTIANPQTLYTSVQIHAPPKSTLSKNSLYGSTENGAKLQEVPTPQASQAKSYVFEKLFQRSGKTVDSSSACTPPSTVSSSTRYSYPSVQLGAKRKEQESITNTLKERFSYPGTGLNNERRVSMKESARKIHLEKDTPNKKSLEGGRSVCFTGTQQSPSKSLLVQHHAHKAMPELLRPKNRNSYCNLNEQLNLLLLHNSTDLGKDVKVEMEHAKLLVTPSSPLQSPRYSLLMGETSSENSSAVNTPQYDLEPLMVTSTMSGLSGLSGASSNQQQQLLLGVDNSSYLGTSHESLGSNLATHSHVNSGEKRDMHALKRELSLDLHPLSTKMAVDNGDSLTNTALTAKQQLLASPNNSNFTDNTSQSVTPSEFGYQHLQRQSSMHSLPETDDNSPVYEEYENTPSNLVSPLSGQKLSSPIKSTISITYNLRGYKDEPAKAGLATREQTKTLLETSFDENTVYEQVKMFRNSVTEVNQLLSEERKSSSELLTHLQQIQEKPAKVQREPPLRRFTGPPALYNQRAPPIKHICPKAAISSDEEELLGDNDDPDIQMSDTNADSLEEFAPEKLLYENMEMRKPKSVYENILGEDLKLIPVGVVEKFEAAIDNVQAELNGLDGVEDVKCEDAHKAQAHFPAQQAVSSECTARKSPSNFSVKELATKFESSPVEQLPAFDFSLRSSLKKPTHNAPVVLEMKASQTSLSNIERPNKGPTASATLKQKLTKSQQITRSLDENAFVREFGSKHLHDLAARSTQQLPELSEITSSRRKSFDFTRPKTLNPPKRLPGMPITEEICLKNEKSTPSLNLDFHKTNNFNHALDSSLEHDYESSELKITPTTENRISLIQNNVALPASDLSNSNLNLSTSSLKVLSGVKLDRERIDKIKEERRQQLTQKYRTESFKSKSKIDLNSAKEDVKFHAESLRVKSKSRGDMRTLQKDIDNLKEFGRSEARAHAGSESTLNAPTTTYTHRVRSISDEKNQNCDVNNATGNVNVTATGSSNSSSNNTSDSSTASDDFPKKAREEFSARATVQKFERKSLDYANGGAGAGGGRERRADGSANGGGNNTVISTGRSSLTATREKISPQFSIRDVTAMFESRAQNQQ